MIHRRSSRETPYESPSNGAGPITGIALFLLILSASIINAQQIVPVSKGSTTAVSGEDYVRGGLHRFFFGSGWRDLWGQEISVNYLDLEKTAGGLTPLKVGGGRQTTSLRFMGANGREYKFRSVNKEFTSVLPKALQGTFVDNVMQDNISAQNPLGALVASPLQDAVGILNATPYLFVLPDDPKLGEFREEFAGLLGMLEEHPNEGENGAPGFMGYNKVVGEEKLIEKLHESQIDQVDYVDYLKVRLLDMVIGDWSRHLDQYRWASMEEASGPRWRPIPRDRDMAFTRYNGILPWMAAGFIPEIESVGEEYPDIENLTLTGAILDRRFLVPISRKTWDSVTGWVGAQLSDHLIDQAVNRMPPEFVKIEGETLRRVLKSRVVQLPEASSELFDLTHEEADLWGSQEDEYVEVSRDDNDHVTVSFYQRGSDGEKRGAPYLRHTFDRSETDEIRLILQEGNDKVVVTGRVKSSIVVKVDGGAGRDEYIDDSKVDGYFLVTPIPDAETSTYFVDSDRDSKFGIGAGTRIDRTNHDEWRKKDAPILPPARDYGNDFSLLPWLGYSSSDNGFLFGLKAGLVGFGFRKDPYASKQTIGAGYAIGTEGFKAFYSGDFRTFIPNARVLIDAETSELEISHFYGYGNETVENAQLDAVGFYDVGQHQHSLQADVQVPERGDFKLYFGARGSYTETRLAQSPALDSVSPYGVESTLLGALRTGVSYDSRDDESVPTSGLFLSAGGEFFPKIFDTRRTFAKARVEGRTYLSADFLRPVTLALRGTVERLYGEEYPYYEGAYLGGKNTLRGFSSQRFFGDMALSASAEVRLTLFSYKLLVNSTFGLIGFSDIGRVYLDSETSDVWHQSYGGGVAISFFDPGKVLAVTLAKSDEGTQSLYIGYGHAF